MKSFIEKAEAYYFLYNSMMGQLTKAMDLELESFNKFTAEQNISILPEGYPIYFNGKEITKENLLERYEKWKNN